MRWGLFPAISVLRKYIYNEELWWRYRELAFRERGIDVGRPPFIGSSNVRHTSVSNGRCLYNLTGCQHL